MWDKKDRHDPDNHDGVITDLEPDLECEVKCAAVLQDQAGSLRGQAIGGPRGDGLQP